MQELLSQLHSELTAQPDWEAAVQATVDANEALLAGLNSTVLVRLQAYMCALGKSWVEQGGKREGKGRTGVRSSQATTLAHWAAAPLTCRVRSGGSPTEVLAALATGAEAIAASSALVALNLVAPEADPLALRDYWIQVLPKFVSTVSTLRQAIPDFV